MLQRFSRQIQRFLKTKFFRSYVIAFVLSTLYILFESSISIGDVMSPGFWTDILSESFFLSLLVFIPVYLISLSVKPSVQTNATANQSGNVPFRLNSEKNKIFSVLSKSLVIVLASVIGAVGGFQIGTRICEATNSSCGYEFEGMGLVIFSVFAGVILCGSIGYLLTRVFAKFRSNHA